MKNIEHDEKWHHHESRQDRWQKWLREGTFRNLCNEGNRQPGLICQGCGVDCRGLRE